MGEAYMSQSYGYSWMYAAPSGFSQGDNGRSINEPLGPAQDDLMASPYVATTVSNFYATMPYSTNDEPYDVLVELQVLNTNGSLYTETNCAIPTGASSCSQSAKVSVPAGSLLTLYVTNQGGTDSTLFNPIAFGYSMG
jgi:hypothetical protein